MGARTIGNQTKGNRKGKTPIYNQKALEILLFVLCTHFPIFIPLYHILYICIFEIIDINRLSVFEIYATQG